VQGAVTRAKNSGPPRAEDTGAFRTPPDAPDDVDGSFRRFREAAVRLVEQVNDQLYEGAPPEDAGRQDLQLMRSIFGKWSADILIALHHVPTAGFEDLRRYLNGISARVLSIKLKELEYNGMVKREILDTRPPRVRYGLTERGWTVAWLAQPIFLYMRVTDRPRPITMGESVVPATVGTVAVEGGLPPRPSSAPGRSRRAPP
jgi:DNA-binding HxlR family transcriptional regulator